MKIHPGENRTNVIIFICYYIPTQKTPRTKKDKYINCHPPGPASSRFMLTGQLISEGRSLVNGRTRITGFFESQPPFLHYG